MIGFRKVNVFLLLVLLAPRALAFANPELSEIMYDLKSGSDDGREWVEFFNNGNASVDLSNYVFFENGTNHKLKLVQGSANVQAFGYAVIASDATKFKNDWPNFSSTLFDSAFSLNNTGESIAIKDGDAIIDQYTYSSAQGGAGDGNSLQKINGTWVGAVPTPGVENKPTPVVITPSSTNSMVPAKFATASTKLPTKMSNSLPPAIKEVGYNPSIPTQQDTTLDGSSPFWSIIFIVFILISAGGVFLIRKSGRKPIPGDDFDLWEE